MNSRVFQTKPLFFIESSPPKTLKDPKKIEKKASKETNNTQSHDSSFTNTPIITKTKNIYSKILFPFDESRRNAHKYLENYTSSRSEISPFLLKFLRSGKKSGEKTKENSSTSLENHPNSLHLSTLNRFLNNNQHRINAFFQEKTVNVPCLSRIVERNVTKNYFPINVNKTRKEMVPVGSCTGFYTNKKKRSVSVHEFSKTQRHDEAKLDRIFCTILKKKTELEEVQGKIQKKIQGKREIQEKLFKIPAEDEGFWKEFYCAGQYYKEFQGKQEETKERYNERIENILINKYKRKKISNIHGNLSVDRIKEKMKDKSMEKFQDILRKIQNNQEEKIKKITKFQEHSLRNRSSFSLHEKPF